MTFFSRSRVEPGKKSEPWRRIRASEHIIVTSSEFPGALGGSTKRSLPPLWQLSPWPVGLSHHYRCRLQHTPAAQVRASITTNTGIRTSTARKERVIQLHRHGIGFGGFETFAGSGHSDDGLENAAVASAGMRDAAGGRETSEGGERWRPRVPPTQAL